MTPMTKRKLSKSRRPLSKEERSLQAIDAKSRREFSASDLQKFTVMEKGIPIQKVIREMEKIQRNHRPKKT